MKLLTIMCGLPGAGKSHLAAKLAEKIKNCVHIDPKGYRVPEYSDLDSEDRRAVDIASWEVAMEQLGEQIDSESNNIIIDTCGTNIDAIRPYVIDARNKGYVIKTVVVHTPASVCKNRVKDEDVVDKYKSKLVHAVKWYHSNTDKVIKIDGCAGNADRVS